MYSLRASRAKLVSQSYQPFVRSTTTKLVSQQRGASSLNRHVVESKPNNLLACQVATENNKVPSSCRVNGKRMFSKKRAIGNNKSSQNFFEVIPSQTLDSPQHKYNILMVLIAALMIYSSILNAEGSEESTEVDQGQIVPESPEPNNKKPDPNQLNQEALQKLQELRGTDIKDAQVILYQYEACPFCSKVRAFFDYYHVPYKVVEVDPIFKSELKKASEDYRKVPVVFVNGIRLVDSSHIIGNIHNVFFSDQEHSTRSEEEEHWRKWVDNSLVHTLPPNIYRTPSEALQAFEYIATKNNFSFIQRVLSKYAGSTAMYAVSKRLKKRHGIEDEREALYSCAREWLSALGSREYLGGNKPNLADLAVYGALNSIEGLDAFHDLSRETEIEGWYNRMRRAIGTSVRL